MSARKASNLLKDYLAKRGLAFKVSARTVGFQDLARDSAVFVTVHGWNPSPLASEIKAFGKDNGFFVDFA